MLGRHYEVEPSYATEANVAENTNKEQQICRDQTPLGATRARVTGLSRGPAVRRTSRDKLTMRSTQLAFGSTHPGLIAGGRYCRPGPNGSLPNTKSRRTRTRDEGERHCGRHARERRRKEADETALLRRGIQDERARNISYSVSHDRVVALDN